MKSNRSQIILTDKMNAYRFSLNRGRGHRLRYLLNRFRWSWYPRWKYVSRFPDHIDIETTNNCNMNCPMCYRSLMFKKGVRPGFMDFKLYKKIIDEAVRYKTFSIRLSWRGEPLIHPRIVDMVKYAKKKGIKEVSFLTNGLLLKGKLAEDLIKAGVDWITVSFDGLGKTYEKIRYPSKFKEGVKRLKDFQALKKKLGKEKPVLKVQSIWSAIKDNPQAYYDTFKDVVDNIATNPFKDYYGWDQIEHDPDFICPQLWQRIVIVWHGGVAPCACSFNENCIVGDLNKQSIYKVWHGKKYKRFRYLHKQKRRLELPCCKICFDGARKKKITVKVDGKESTHYTYSKNYEKTKNKRISKILNVQSKSRKRRKSKKSKKKK